MIAQAVDYSSMAQSQEFENYVKLSSELMRTDVGDLSRNETLAFFINIYNALVIHGTVQFGTPTSTWQRLKVCLDFLNRLYTANPLLHSDFHACEYFSRHLLTLIETCGQQWFLLITHIKPSHVSCRLPLRHIKFSPLCGYM